MKKLIFLLAVSASSLFFAQEAQITYGIKAGLNISRIGNTDMMDEAPRNGLHAGFFANFPFAEKFSFQPELMYSNYGEKEKGYDEFTEEGIKGVVRSDFSIKLDYIVVPLMFQYNVLPKFYIEAGPEVGILFSERIKGTTIITTENPSTIENQDFKSPIERKNFQGVNFGIAMGAGYYITPKFGVNMRYVAGISDVIKDNDLHHSNSVRNKVLQFGVMYKF